MSKYVEFTRRQDNKSDFICFNAFEIAAFLSNKKDGKEETHIWLSGINDEFVVAEKYHDVFRIIKDAIS